MKLISISPDVAAVKKSKVFFIFDATVLLGAHESGCNSDQVQFRRRKV